MALFLGMMLNQLLTKKNATETNVAITNGVTTLPKLLLRKPLVLQQFQTIVGKTIGFACQCSKTIGFSNITFGNVNSQVV